MARSRAVKSKTWQHTCGLVMAFAMVVSMVGTIPFLRYYDPAGPGASLGDGLLLFIWVFGLLGVFITYIADAARKRLLAVIALGWSIAALAWDAVANACPENLACARDTSDHPILIGACLILVGVLVAYDVYLQRQARRL